MRTATKHLEYVSSVLSEYEIRMCHDIWPKKCPHPHSINLDYHLAINLVA